MVIQNRNRMRHRQNQLKNVHPEKHALKIICKLLYCFGLGDCWYEDRSSNTWIYVIWAVTSNSFMMACVINEILSHFRNDLTLTEKNDSMQLSIGHSLICAKIAVFHLRKNQLRNLLRTLLEENRTVFPSSEIDQESVKKARKYCLAVSSVVYVTLMATLVDAFMAYYKEGIPIRIEVTFYPGYRITGVFINILRFLTEVHLWYFVSVMVLIDCLAVCCLTFSGYKFRRVRLHFQSLWRRLSKNPERKHIAPLEKQFWKDFVVGIKLHDDALWCAGSVQDALGNIYSIQIIESIGLLVSCLIKFAATERPIVFVLANLFFTIGMVVITGAYMMDAADVSYEASFISTAIFHSGWEFTTPRAGLRALVVLAIQRSQMPVYMTAFGIIQLSYPNFITVLRSSYSFFAVMY